MQNEVTIGQIVVNEIVLALLGFRVLPICGLDQGVKKPATTVPMTEGSTKMQIVQHRAMQINRQQ